MTYYSPQNSPTRPDWFDDALCKTAGVNMFPSNPAESWAARRVCFRCPVKEECLEYGMERHELGMYGGVGERNRTDARRAIRRGQAS